MRAHMRRAARNFATSSSGRCVADNPMRCSGFGTSRSSRLIMILGVGILFAAFALLGLSNHLLAST